MSQQPAPNTELLWKQYELHTGLYKFYIDSAIKINVLYYAVTGAILTFFFKDPGAPLIRYSLLLPILLSLTLGALFFYGAHLNVVVREEMVAITDALGLYTFPEVRVLSVLLRTFGVIFFAVGLALLWLVSCGYDRVAAAARG